MAREATVDVSMRIALTCDTEQDESVLQQITEAVAREMTGYVVRVPRNPYALEVSPVGAVVVEVTA